jgi:hypothetical protein
MALIFISYKYQIYLITLFLGEIRFINRTNCKNLVELTTQSMPCRLESSYKYLDNDSTKEV